MKSNANFSLALLFISSITIAMDAPQKKITPSTVATLVNPGPAQAVCFSSDNKNLVITGMHPQITIWDTSDYSKPKSQFALPIGAAWSMALSSNNAQAAVGFLNGTIQLWDLEKQTSTQKFADNDTIWEVQYTPNQAAILSAGNNGTCKLWDLNSQAYKTFDAKAGPVWSAHLNPAFPDQFAACSDDNTLTVWDTRKEDAPLYRIQEEVPVYRVTHNNEGKMLIGAAYQFILRNHNAELLALYNTHGRKLAAGKAVLAGTGDVPLAAVAIKFMPGNNLTFVAPLDNKEVLFGNLEDAEKALHFIVSKENCSPQSLDISPDGQRLAIGTFSHDTFIFDISGIDDIKKQAKEEQKAGKEQIKNAPWKCLLQ